VQPEAVLLETRSPDADLAFDAPKTSTEEVLARLENCANTLSELRRAHRRAERSRGRIADCRRGDRSCRTVRRVEELASRLALRGTSRGSRGEWAEFVSRASAR